MSRAEYERELSSSVSVSLSQILSDIVVHREHTLGLTFICLAGIGSSAGHAPKHTSDNKRFVF